MDVPCPYESSAVCVAMRICNSLVYLQGAGLLGVYGVALLKSKGYRTVYCTDTNKSRLDIVRRFGASPVLVENGTVDVYFLSKSQI